MIHGLDSQKKAKSGSLGRREWRTSHIRMRLLWNIPALFTFTCTLMLMLPPPPPLSSGKQWEKINAWIQYQEIGMFLLHGRCRSLLTFCHDSLLTGVAVVSQNGCQQCFLGLCASFLFPSRGGVCFPTPWVWSGLWLALIECRSDILRLPSWDLWRSPSTCFHSWKPVTLWMSDLISEWVEATWERATVPRHWEWCPKWVPPGDNMRRERPSQLSAIWVIPLEVTNIIEQRTIPT